MKTRIHITFWGLMMCLAGLAAFEVFSHPSNAYVTGLFGFSIYRLAIALIPILFILTCIVMIFLIIFFPEKYNQIRFIVERQSHNTLFLIGSSSFWITLLLGAPLSYYRVVISPNESILTPLLGNRFESLCAYLDRIWALLFFVTICTAVISIYIFFVLKLPPRKHLDVFIYCGACVAILISTLSHWIIFIFKLHIFEQIPGWYWPIIPKSNLLLHGLIFALFLLIILGIQFLIDHFPGKSLLHLFLLSMVFIGLQYNIGAMEGRGIASLTDRFFLSYHRIYTEEACNASISAHEAITQYEVLYPSMFLQTKPPGVLWSAFVLNKIANAPVISTCLDQLSSTISLSEFLPRMASAACQRNMTLVTLLFPVFSTLVIWLLFLFFKLIIINEDYEKQAGYSALLFILTPNIVMLSLFMDQAIYPSLFLFLAGFTLLGMQKQSMWVCFLCGTALYAAIFLSFSMLPIFAIPIIYFICTLWQENNVSGFWQYFRVTLLPMGLGILVSLILFKLSLNYDIVTRYRHMMETRIEGDFYARLDIAPQETVTFLEKIQQTMDAAVLNNIEIAVAIGFPIFILFVIMGMRSFLRVLGRKPDKAAAVNTSLFLTYVLLNSLRIILGEVGRLWMFWAPIMILLAVQLIFPLIRRNKSMLVGLIIVQTITLFLTYQFQDFVMPQLMP